MDESSDESIVENTPVKKKLKRTIKQKRRLEKVVKQKEKNESLLLNELVEEFEKNITQNGTPQNPSELLINKEDTTQCKSPIQSNNLTDPIYKPASTNKHNVYVFYLIEEILKFSPNYFPKNSHVHLVGCIYEKTNFFYLTSMQPKDYFKLVSIKLDLREVDVKPSSGDEILAFCLLTFTNETPIAVVKFFRKLTTRYSNYVELMLLLRTTVPQENFDMISTRDQTFVEEELNSDNQYMEELTQTLVLDSASSQMENDEILSELTLQALLDDISFEKV